MKHSAAKPSRSAKPDAIALLAALNATPGAQDPPSGTASTPSRSPRTLKPGARAGLRQIAGHFPEHTLRALKHVMAEEGATLQALLDEAIQDLLVKKGRAKLAR